MHELFSNIAILITLTVFITYLNFRFIKMQPTIAIMSTSLVLSIFLLIANHLGFHALHRHITHFVRELHFRELLLDSMLGLLLFASALTLNFRHLKKQKWEITTLATLGVTGSMLIIGFGIYTLLSLLNVAISLPACLLFGALISPTDPIAVLATFKANKAPRKLEMLVSAESLFNDGAGIVLFASLYSIVFSGHHHLTFTHSCLLFIRTALGGIAYGLILGYVTFFLMKSIDEHKMEILITLAVAIGGYAFAQFLDVSGPLAMVTCGIFIANHKHEISMSKNTRQHLESFWEIIDELLNAILFLLIGFELLLVHFSWDDFIGALIAIPLVLFARFITVTIIMALFKSKRHYPKYTIRILTWGGLRGGLAVALAMMLPDGNTRNIFLPMTYAVVVFTILIQGSTIPRLVRKCKTPVNPK